MDSSFSDRKKVGCANFESFRINKDIQQGFREPEVANGALL
jgi:hypothetical protein